MMCDVPRQREGEGGFRTTRQYRIALVVSHPIQYFTSLFKHLNTEPQIDLTVLYCSLHGARKMKDPGFGTAFAWDIPLLEGYRYKELKNWWRGPLKGFFSCINPGVVPQLVKNNYDAVIVFGWGTLSTWLAYSTARWTGVPWMVYGDSIFIYEDGSTWLKRLLKRLVLRALFKNTSAFLVMGTLNRLLYKSYGAPEHKLFFVPYPIDIDFFAERVALAKLRTREVRARHGIAPEAVVVLFVGKLVGRKRPSDVIGAFKVLQPSLPNLALAFVGDGELRRSLGAEAASHGLRNVHFLGFKNQTEMPEMYGMSDIFVLPSANEPWGLAINEAMASGLPVIASDKTGASADIVQDGVNGFVCPCGDVEALAGAMRMLVDDPELRRRMGNRSQEIIKDFGYPHRCVAGIVEALEAVVHPGEAPEKANARHLVPENTRAQGRSRCEY